MDNDLVKKYGDYVERTAWLQVFFGMLTQVSENAFPSYNVVLGFWGVYCAHNRHGRATFGYISFQFLSMFLDVIFCAVYGSSGKSSGFKFALTMFIFCLLIKLPSLYSTSHFFASIGGANSLESHMGESAYDALARSGSMSNSGGGVGGYYAPHDADEEQDDIGRRRSDVM